MGRNEISAAAPSQSAAPSRWKRLLPGILISLAALAGLFSVIDLRQTLDAFRQADRTCLVLGICGSLLWLVLRGKVWQTLLQGKASYRDVFLTLNEGYLLNNLLPFRLGEVGRAYLLGRKAGLGFWQVLPSVLLERIFDLALAVGLFVCTLPFVAGVGWAAQAAALTGGIVALGLLGIYLLAHNRPRVTAWLERLGQRWPLVQRLTGGRVAAFFNGLGIITDPRLFLRALGWLLLNWALSVLVYGIFLRAFFSPVPALWAVFVLGAGSLGIAAPSSPGAVGVFEAALVAALAVFKVDPSQATAFAITLHLSNYLTTGLIGGFALLREGETLSSLYARLGRLKDEK